MWILADNYSAVTNQSDTGNELQHSPAFTVQVVDPGGEGDLSLGWSLEAPRISQDYGANGSVKAGCYHCGLDLTSWKRTGSAVAGTPVWPAADGEVVMVKDSCPSPATELCAFGWGNIIVIKHPGGYYTYYAHLQSVAVAVGQHVTAGETVIEEVGSSGRVQPPHLHHGVLGFEPAKPRDLGGCYTSTFPSESTIPHLDPREFMAHSKVTVLMNAAMRKNPLASTSTNNFGAIAAGQQFETIGGGMNGWRMIFVPKRIVPTTDPSYQDVDRYGWVPASSVQQMASGVGRVGVVTSLAEANLRYLPVMSSPSPVSAQITKIYDGQRYAVREEKTVSSEVWYRIDHPSVIGANTERTGWVRARFIRIE